MGNSVSLKAERHRMRGVVDNVLVTNKYVLTIDFNELKEIDVRKFAINTFLTALNKTRWPRNVELSEPKVENGVFRIEFKRGLADNTSDAIAALRDFQGKLIGGLYRVSENFRDANLNVDLPSNSYSIFDTYEKKPSYTSFTFCATLNEEFAQAVSALKKSIENEFGPSNPIRLNIL